MSDIVDINHIEVGEDQTTGSIEFAMITRADYDLWHGAYQTLKALRSAGLIDDGDIAVALSNMG